MKHLLIVLCFLCSAAHAQDLNYCGTYEGVISSDSAVIHITFELKPDATYIIRMDFNFTRFCNLGKDSWTYEGKWTSKKDLVYFEPTKHEPWGDFSFIQQEVLRPAPGIKTFVVSPMDGYSHCLKVSNDKKTGSRKIWFHVSWDCFEYVWDWYFVERVGLVMFRIV
jgi:hypothetical protein